MAINNKRLYEWTALAVLLVLLVGAAYVTILFSDSEYKNKEYREKDKPTNILTFPLSYDPLSLQKPEHFVVIQE